MKRGSSGLSLVVAINKPSGMTSHDVVNRCRRVFSERRVGHTGTLDPLATGVLPICVGPATRLDKYLTGHDKRYRTTMRFGFETATDDREGELTVWGDLLPDLIDGDFAETYIAGLVGKRQQVPPSYSAVKVNGKKAYEQARKGHDVELEPREIEVFEASLVDRLVDADGLKWVIDFSVSKGTYIRALVRDIGRELGCPAHVFALERRKAGSLELSDCVSLETLESLGVQAAIDPVRLLGFKTLFADGEARRIQSGGKLSVRDLSLFFPGSFSDEFHLCACMGTLEPCEEPLAPDELVSVVVENRLQAIYRFDADGNCLKPDCVFAVPIVRTAFS